MSFYTDLRTVAENLIEKYGEAVTITRKTQTINPITEAKTTVTTTQTLDVVKTSDTKTYKDGSLTTRPTFYISTSGQTYEPSAGDFITWGGLSYEILEIQKAGSSSVNVYYKAVCKEGL